MKIVELDLRAFGPFKDHPVSFPQDKGFHILYGPNEAGKTAALNAITHFFFRIPQNTAYGFRHGYENLRVGVTLSNGGESQTYVRRTGRDRSLRDQHDKDRILESLLHSMLNNVDKERFRRMFGLSLDQLAEGAQQMLEGGGEVGAALFGAATGMPTLIQARKQLNEEMENLFKSGGSKPELNKLSRTYRNLGKDIKAKQLLPKDYEAKRKEREALEREVATLSVRLGELESEISRHKNLHKALPRVRERDDLAQALKELGDVPWLDDDFASAYQSVLQQLRENERIAADAREILKEITSDLEAIEVDEALLAQAERIQELSDNRAQNVNALSDRDGLEQKYNALRRSLESALAEIGEGASLEDIESLRISSKEQKRINQLATDRDATQKQLTSLRDQLAEAKRKRDTVAKTIKGSKADEAPPALISAIAHARKQGDLEGETDMLRESIRALEEDAGIALEQLPRWDGTAEDLERTPLPTPDQCERFQSRFRELDLAIADGKDRLKEQQDALRDMEQELARLEEGAPVPSPDDLKQARTIRDVGWTLICDAWAKGEPPDAAVGEARDYAAESGADNLADAYAKRVAAADDVADALYKGASTIHERATLQRNAETTRTKIDELEQTLNAHKKQREQLENDWRNAWSEAAIEPDSPETMREWLRQRDTVVDLAEELRDKRRQLQTVEGKIREHADVIKAGLNAAGESVTNLPSSFAQLLDYADGVVEKRRKMTSELQAKRDRLAEYDDEELPKLTADLEQLDEMAKKLDNEWASAMKSLGLAAGTPSQEARDMVTQRQELLQQYQEAKALEERIEQINNNHQRFYEEVSAFLKEFAPDLVDSPANEAVLTLRKRVEEAQQNANTRDNFLKQQTKEKERLQEAERAVHAAQDDLNAKCKEANVSKPEALPEAVRKSDKRRELEKRLDQLDDNISELAGAQSVDEFKAEARESEEAAINAKLHEFETEQQTTKQQRDAKLSELGGVNKEWQALQTASGEAAELREKQERVATKIAHLTERYGRLEMARIVLDETIDRYRQQHEGPLLKRAGEIFTRLTLGSFTELRVDFNHKGEQVLCAMRDTPAEEVHISGLSEGTRDQLYLALRIASLEDYVQRHPMPVILDDILVNFDDDRAQAALQILAELSQHTQVIYFTHHQHLVALAQEAVPAADLATQHLHNGTN